MSRRVNELLRESSRSFYLSLQALPGPVRAQIGLAYLLARISDTLADTEVLPVEARLEALETLGRRIAGEAAGRIDFVRLLAGEADELHRRLAGHAGEAVLALDELSPGDRALVRTVLGVIISGQALDLKRFAGAGPAGSGVVALPDGAALEDYTFRVAGTVGEFWTRICAENLWREEGIDLPWLIGKGVEFGQGLQLVNILRDLPADLRQGRCYLPELELREAGLRPRDLLDAGAMARLGPVFERWRGRAEGLLRSGWDYTLALPAGSVRMRLACAWPVLIGIRTLGALRGVNVLDGGRRVKVDRRAVRGILIRTLLYYPWRQGWAGLFDREHRWRVESA